MTPREQIDLPNLPRLIDLHVFGQSVIAPASATLFVSNIDAGEIQ